MKYLSVFLLFFLGLWFPQTSVGQDSASIQVTYTYFEKKLFSSPDTGFIVVEEYNAAGSLSSLVWMDCRNLNQLIISKQSLNSDSIITFNIMNGVVKESKYSIYEYADDGAVNMRGYRLGGELPFQAYPEVFELKTTEPYRHAYLEIEKKFSGKIFCSVRIERN